MKIAVIFTGSIKVKKGLFNNVIDRVKHLKSKTDINVDVFLIQNNPSWLFKKIKRTEVCYKKQIMIDDVIINIIYIKLTVLEYLLVHRLKIIDIIGKRQIKKYISLYKDYDLLSVHGVLDGFLASLVKKKYEIPFVVTWHGSDINVYPNRSVKTFNTIRNILNEANFNFFVSKNLKENSDRIVKNENKTHLYTGISENFTLFSDDVKEDIKTSFNIKTKYVIGFVGSIVAIKNVSVLPKIFQEVQKKLEDVSFIVVGDGVLLPTLKNSIKERNVANVKFTGNVQPEEVPAIMNILNLLVLPSLNEGLGLVALEALKCGAHVVGSNIGGIPEVVGQKNSITLDDNFVENFSNRVIDILINKESLPPYPEEFNWDESVKKELEVYKNIINN